MSSDDEEINDVLGAIRRMVADETRARASAANDPGPSFMSDTLVLTEEMQVAPPRRDMALAASVDPEMMRELVREIVRDELQAELGDRISQNVRKMVRREIARAMTARKLSD